MTQKPTPGGQTRLSQIVSELYLIDDDTAADPLWAELPDAARQAGARSQRLLEAVRKRDLDPIVRIANDIEAEQAAKDAAQAKIAAAEQLKREKAASASKQQGDSTSEKTFTSEELRHAYNAFKKRLKTTQRDEDSRLGGRYTSGGSKGIVGITPPREFPVEIWAVLVKEGRIKKAGGGMYSMP